MYSLFAFPAALWTASIATAALALFWHRHTAAYPQRALVYSVVSTALAVFGLVNIHVTASQTVNGQVRWAINSKWFFLVALAFGCFSLARALKTNLVDQPGAKPSEKTR
jgi:hypothetical protein